MVSPMGRPIGVMSLDRAWDWDSPIPDAIDGFGAPVSRDEVIRRLAMGHELWVASTPDSGQNFVIEGKKISEAAFLSKSFVTELLLTLPLDKARDSNGGAIYTLRAAKVVA
jgi:hypothetical protein